MPWQPPSLTVKWGPYFKPDPAEEKSIVEMTQAALGSGGKGTPLIQLRNAVQKIAPIFGIENVEAELEKLEEERDATDARELAATTAAFDAEARAQRSVAGATPAASGSGGGGGRSAGGKVNAS